MIESVIRIVLGWSRSSDPKGVPTYHPINGVFNCVTSGKRENTQQYIMELNPIICSTRGRSKGDWYSDEPHYQNLEIGDDKTSNSITSVQKDNLLLIPEPICKPSSSD